MVTCGTSRFTLLTLPVEDYPALPRDADRVRARCAATCSPPPSPRSPIAAGRDDTLPVLTGVRIEIEGDTVTLAATDRYRLAVRELAWTPEQPDLSAIALVPARALADTAKSFGAAAR